MMTSSMMRASSRSLLLGAGEAGLDPVPPVFPPVVSSIIVVSSTA